MGLQRTTERIAVGLRLIGDLQKPCNGFRGDGLVFAFDLLAQTKNACAAVLFDRSKSFAVFTGRTVQLLCIGCGKQVKHGKTELRLPSGHSGPVLTLSNAARASLPSPRLLVGDASVWAALLGVAVRHVICWF